MDGTVAAGNTDKEEMVSWLVGWLAGLDVLRRDGLESVKKHLQCHR